LSITAFQFGELCRNAAFIKQKRANELLRRVVAIGGTVDTVSSLYIIMLAILYVAAMIYIVKPFLKEDLYGSKEQHRKPLFIFFLRAHYFVLCYRVIRIHALFGALWLELLCPMFQNSEPYS
jgi:hypothetical protein